MGQYSFHQSASHTLSRNLLQKNQTLHPPSIYEQEFRVRYCNESKMKLVQRKRMNSLREGGDNTMRSRGKRPVEKWSQSNNRNVWMSTMMWFWCHLSKMHCSPAVNKRKEKHNKLEEDKQIHHCWEIFQFQIDRCV